MAKSILKLENVWKIYQLDKVELVALKNVNLDIQSGSFISIMGPSGSGKSTFLNMIGTLDFPSKGKVYLKDKDISLFTEDELSVLRGKTIGFIFQEFNILPNLTALENVTLPLIFQGVPKEERIARAKEMLATVGLANRISHKTTELSGGERQRVAIARAFITNPEMVIADEPTGNLDSVSGKKIMEILTEFHKKQNKTIVIVTHDINVAKNAEKIIHIYDGQIKEHEKN